MSFDQLYPTIKSALASLGYRELEHGSDPKAFGNGAATFERDDAFFVTVLVDRTDLALEIRPRSGVTAATSYDAMRLLKELDRQGRDVCWIPDLEPENVSRFLIQNLSLLLEIRSQLQFSLFAGASIEAFSKKPLG